MPEAQEIRRGYEQFVPPQAPPGMYFDPASELFLPQGVRLASRGRVAAAWFLGLLLFSITLGIGYIAWSLFAWGQGRSPAQRILSLRCWLPEAHRVAGRKQMALRQVTGFCLNGQLLSGFFIWLTSKNLRSAGDFFASTVILHDPDGVLQLSSAAPPGPHPALRTQAPEVPVLPPGRPPGLCGCGDATGPPKAHPRYATSSSDNRWAGNRPPEWTRLLGFPPEGAGERSRKG